MLQLKALFDHLNDIEAPYCRAANDRGEILDTSHFYNLISRLGDGIFWYLIIAVLPAIHGRDGLQASLQMLLVGMVSLLIYKLLKHLTGRRRPCHQFSEVRRHAPVLDLYSFPSGHTMHAVGFTAVLMAHFPTLGIAVAPFVFLVATSRLVLGLHYPSDVIAGAVIGAGVAWTCLTLLA